MVRFRAGWVVALALFLGLACSGTTKGQGPGASGAGDEGPGSSGAGDGSVAAGGEGSTAHFVDQILQVAVDKLDLLLVVDNSISMADKQELLAQAMPLLVQRLVTPRCVRDCTSSDHCTLVQEREGISTGTTSEGGLCATGHPEMPPIRDLHVGVITSSLGSHGANGANDVCVSAAEDDHAHLLGELRGLEGTWKDAGFLAWDAQGQKSPPGDRDPGVFVDKFTKMIGAAGEHGCGYESTLEAWYRFLIDPEPPRHIVVEGSKSVAQGIDQTVLDQRAQFLRPDSVVAIVMLTDENDCSIIDEGYGYAVATAATPMLRGTAVCAVNPNDHCCQSCGEQTANQGCPALATDPECQKGVTLAQSDDDLNLRCWQQKRRFGFDLLYPTTRYAKALSSPLVSLRSGELVQNPLFRAPEGGPPRDRGLVFLAGIVGVPWQDLADEESLEPGAGLRYLTVSELDQLGRWDVVLGRPNTDADPPVFPSDPLMLETPVERQGMNPVTGASLVPANSTNPRANPINGHEQVDVGARDLQYACTFPLTEPRVCGASHDRGCDCYPEDVEFNRPLCQPPGGGAATTTQYYAKAYPGLRHLAVLKELGDNAIVASTCPKILEPTHPDYGYNPAIDALVGRVREAFKDKCFPSQLPLDPDGQVQCAVVEAVTNTEACNCASERNRKPVSAELAAVTRKAMQAQSFCGGAGGVPCASICLCELPQLSGEQLSGCQNEPVAPQVPGFCYINAMPNEAQVGNPALVASCSRDTQRLIRFVGDSPTRGATVWISCQTPAL